MQPIYYKRNELFEVKPYKDKECTEAFDFTNAKNIYMAGYGNTTSAINAIDFKMTSGNIDDGTIQMFGIL